MGLMVDKTYGVTVVHHGGDVFGFHSDVIWLPDYDVGAVILTNGDGGSSNPRSVPAQAARGAVRRQSRSRCRDRLRRQGAHRRVRDRAQGAHDPRRPRRVGQARREVLNAALGTIAVSHKGGKTFFDFGPLQSEMASRTAQDGTVSFLSLVPGFLGQLELVVSGDNLVLRDAQHEYVYTPAKK